MRGYLLVFIFENRIFGGFGRLVRQNKTKVTILRCNLSLYEHLMEMFHYFLTLFVTDLID